MEQFVAFPSSTARRLVVVDGVMWCPVHDGVADECNAGDHCDRWASDDDEQECELKTLMFDPDEVPS